MFCSLTGICFWWKTLSVVTRVIQLRIGKTGPFRFLSWKYAKVGFHFESRHKKYMNITTCHRMHIKLIKMLSVSIVSLAAILGVYLNIKLTLEPDWIGDVCELKWGKIFMLKSLQLLHSAYPDENVLHVWVLYCRYSNRTFLCNRFV